MEKKKLKIKQKEFIKSIIKKNHNQKDDDKELMNLYRYHNEAS